MAENVPILCPRCGTPMRVAPRQQSEPRLLKRATGPTGVCAHCAVAAFLKQTDPLNRLLAESPHGPQMLLAPHVQQQFGRIMAQGQADMQSEEIDWQHVVDHWELPMPGQRTAVGRRERRHGL